MSIDRRMDKKDVVHAHAHTHTHTHTHIYIMKYYSVIKSKIMPFAETWMDLETNIQSEISQKEKNIVY